MTLQRYGDFLLFSKFLRIILLSLYGQELDFRTNSGNGSKSCPKECILDSAIYREKIKERSDETIANIAITLIHQCDVLIKGLIEWQKKNFLENGGIKEEMYRARKAYRDNNGFNGQNGSNGQNKY